MLFQTLLDCIDAGSPGVWISVHHTRGSVPREAGAGMVVTADRQFGTIGGGHLEWKAVELARERLALGHRAATLRRYPLGPSLGQCCGGVVDLMFRPFDAAGGAWGEALARAEAEGGDVALFTRCDGDADHTALSDPGEGAVACSRHAFDPWHVWLFGAGHVGAALERVLGVLDCRVTWVDTRAEAYPASVAPGVRILVSEAPQDEVGAIRPGSDVLVLTHSHVLDFDIVRALLVRDDLGQIGMIGSTTKAARFRRRLAERGVPDAAIARLSCPIGTHARGDKHPGAIALDVATDLLARRREALAARRPVAA